jgi:hypothetical protein
MEFIYLCIFLSVGALIALAVMHYADRQKTKHGEFASHA